MKVTVLRFDPDTGRRWEQEYVVDLCGHSMTVMDVLQKISDELDSSLAYFRHSMCNHGICARCAMLVNGRPKLACVELASNYAELNLEPIPNMDVVRDLVTLPKEGMHRRR